MVDVLEKHQGEKKRSLVVAEEEKQIKVKVSESDKSRVVIREPLTREQMVTY